ncbi:glutathione peroxidase [Rhizobium sp. NRK18]|uniref:glutathione peroxidase n=1 Tax=Rhizobium sp. NRK18 TaxID=2964667 RepID=UPI0021C40892|nr:glutathione peroxidase [Rhizobium sp. NRK18]MCQ2003601.1 glutathione peroxidase [Rhizobium sp. NRK18]
MTVYDYQARTNAGQEIGLDSYRGKVLLIVNTASACGFTPQYAGLETLYKTYKDDLVILAFPCNQFGAQEKGSDEDIRTFCDLNFNISFPLFAKVDVNGSDAHPLFKYLKEALPGVLGTEAIKWNFTKFLVGRDGKPLKRFAPNDKPEDIEDDIKAAIAA